MAGFTGFYDADVSDLALTVGQAYTAVLSQPDDSTYWGLSLRSRTDPYPAGRTYFLGRGELSNNPGDDVRFRVTPAAAAVVPAPAGLAVLGAGAAALAGLRGRRRAWPASRPAGHAVRGGTAAGRANR